MSKRKGNSKGARDARRTIATSHTAQGMAELASTINPATVAAIAAIAGLQGHENQNEDAPDSGATLDPIKQETLEFHISDLSDLFTLAVPMAQGQYGSDVERLVELLREYYPRLSQHTRGLIRTSIETGLREGFDASVRAKHRKLVAKAAMAPQLLSQFVPTPVFEADWRTLLTWMVSVDRGQI